MSAKRDWDGMEKRRLEGGKLLRRGVSRSEVARVLGVARQSVAVWERRLAAGGTGALKSPHSTRRTRKTGSEK